MKFSESWLREWVNPDIDTAQLVEKLTMAGLEVDAVSAVAGDFSGVLVAEILETEQHPDADKLRVCQVAGHPEGVKQVVCGAANARVGIKVPFATVGSVLPPGDDGKPFKIKKAKLRGVESFGMLCGQTELLVGDDDSGLFELPADAPVGESLRDYLSLNDNTIEVDLTPNRSDCLSLRGLARELGVLCKMPVTSPPSKAVSVASDMQIDVSVSPVDACPKYICRTIEGIDNTVDTPLWMQERLRRSGIRSIDPVVDVTNFVLLELGQPMHAFDLEKVDGAFDVRFAEADESLELLNEQTVKLNKDTLVIADDRGPVAMAGVMGGKRTSVSGATQSILLESAYFNPITIAGKARNYGLHTDSSHRFERGVDYELPEYAISRATELLLSIVGGKAGPVKACTSIDSLPETRTVMLTQARISAGLGFSIDASEVKDILNRLGLKVVKEDVHGWHFEVPSYRFDISIDADLLEELARIYGYNNLPTTTFSLPAYLPKKPETQLDIETLKDHLASRGLQEAITYSFIDPSLQKKIFGEQKSVEVLNPISQDMSVMRTSLLPGLLQTLVKNISKQVQSVKIFESGLRFEVTKDYNAETLEGLNQVPTLSALIYGPRHEVTWVGDNKPVDFYDLKGLLESVMEFTSTPFELRAVVPQKHLHPGQSAHVYLEGKCIGYIGALHPQIQKDLDIAQPIFVFEVDLTSVLDTKVPVFAPISRFPEVARDLAVVVDQDVDSASLEKEIRSKAGDYLKHLKVFDVYQGKGIDLKRKSMAFSLIFQHSSRTLTEDEINAPVDSVVQHLENTFNAQLR